MIHSIIEYQADGNNIIVLKRKKKKVFAMSVVQNSIDRLHFARNLYHYPICLHIQLLCFVNLGPECSICLISDLSELESVMLFD